MTTHILEYPAPQLLPEKGDAKRYTVEAWVRSLRVKRKEIMDELAAGVLERTPELQEAIDEAEAFLADYVHVR